MSDLPPGVDEEDFELYGDAEPQDPVDDYGDDHGIPESHQNGHAPVKEEPNDDPMEDEAENGDDPMEDEAQNGDDDAADAPDAKEDGERDDDEEDEEEEDSSDDEFVVNVGEIKRPEPKVQGVQGKVDLDSTPLINGQPIYDLDLATMEDRPWRKPGADINDYFNYGFNEESWNMYCERQKKLRHEFSNNQAAVNKSLFNSINILNPILTTTSTGRQLVNICGAENPHNNHKVVVDLTKPPPAQLSMNIKQENIIRTDLTNIIPKSSASSDAKPIAVLDFSKPPPMMQNLVVSQPTQDGPPGMEDSAAPGTEPTTPSVGHQGSAIPTMDMSMPPPGFNPNMPPPQMRGPPPTHMLPPGFGGMTANHAMAGFANPPPRFSRPPPLRDFHPPGYGQPPGMDGFDQPRDYIERSFSGESDDEEHRRSRKHRRRSHSRSPSSKRRREDKDRDRERERDRDYGRERNEERDRERERGERERGDRDRERTERRRRHEEHERESSRSSRSRRDRGERDDREKEREKRHRDSDSESGRKERRRREVSGEKESRRERGKD